jgi:2,3-dihydroxyphenylpropionate 1,2-dioxygenase
MLVTASHSPIIEFPQVETDQYLRVVAALDQTRTEVADFDPELVVLFGVDHYGGHHMSSMPSFCIGVEATALADVGGTPGKLSVPREVAVQAVNHTRQAGVDVAVSYAMDVDHGFTQALVKLTGAIDRYPVLPIFVACIQPPFVPFARARALGQALGTYAASLDLERVLIIGTGGLSHNPRLLFPPIDEVSDEWRPYHLHGRAQVEVPQQTWIEYEIEAHKVAAAFLASPDVPDEAFGLNEAWDRAFLDVFCSADMAEFDGWLPDQVVDDAGIGAMEVLAWVAAAEAMHVATGEVPVTRLQQVCRVIGIGYGITTAGPAPILAATF